MRLLWCEHIHPLAMAVLQGLLGRCSWQLSLQCGTRTQTSRVGGVLSSHRNRRSADRKALPALRLDWCRQWALEEAASHAWTTLSCSTRWDLSWFPTVAEPKAASAFPTEFLLLGNNPAGVGDAAVSCSRECQGLHAEHCVWHQVRSLCHYSLCLAAVCGHTIAYFSMSVCAGTPLSL